MTIFLLQLLCIGSIAYLFHLASMAFPHYYFIYGFTNGQ